MTYASEAYNRHIMNKMAWMSRNLRNFNDTVSISNWAHTMSILKNLLLPPLRPPAPQTIRQPPPTQVITPEPARSITPPNTISFQPAKKRPLTQSAPRCTINKHSKHSKPSPLTIYTLCSPNIASTDSLSQPPKRRKISTPPSVDYFASTGKTLPTTTATAASPTNVKPLPTSTAAAASQTISTPGLGSHLWYRDEPEEVYWSPVKVPETAELKVVKTPLDFGSNYTLLDTTTGKTYYFKFTEDEAARLFKT